MLRKRSRATGALLVLVGMILAIFSGVLAAQPASAAEVNGVTSVDIVNAPPYVKDAQYQVSATWAVPDSAQPGDTFTLNFPDALVGFGATINLPDADGNIVGTCQVTESQFVCTLSDFVATHNNVHGTLNFNAKFVEEMDEEQIEFTTGNNVTIVTDVEGGVGTAGPDDLPASPTKFGYMNNDGTSMTWVIRVPSDDLGAGPNPIITDDYDAPLVFDPAQLTVRSIAAADWAQKDDTSVWTYLGQGTGTGSYTLTDRPADTAFDVQLNGANTDGSRVYEVIVVMDLPVDVEDGDIFNNRAIVNGNTYTATPVPYVEAGGGGEGDNLGDFEITKTVVGTGAPVVAGVEYTVDYSFEENGQTVTGSVTIADGETDGLTDIAEGTVVTLSEVTPLTEGILYGTPVFSGEGVTDNGDGTATFTVIDGLIEVGLENSAVQITGGFLVTKTVTGSAAGNVGDAEYTVDYSYTLDGEEMTGSLVIADGATDGLADVPYGTVVTLSEVAPETAGVVYGTPIFEGDGVTDNGDGTASFTVGDSTVEIALENPAEIVTSGFELTKVVTGDAAHTVQGAEYTVNYSIVWGDENQSDTVTISDGETIAFEDVPFGAVITLSEVAPTAPHVIYGTPIFSGPGITQNADGSVTFTAGDELISIGLENPVNFDYQSFQVTKTVTGDGAAKVIDMSYTVDYSAMVPGETEPRVGSFEVSNGTIYEIYDVPEGTVVTLTEVTATAPGVTFGTPKFTGAGVTDNGDGSATFTQGAGLVEIGLENPVTAVPPTAPPKGGSTTSLAITGADSTPLIVIAGLLLLSGAIALVARRRRSQA
ncbi:DUF5979 domain-containing protein [Microbacterium sp. NPDC008134]|uniref:DUF5979 domain-containing protein n=1 Tax=Microbacterium sp. NPDC008134 TaxID=3364183 RepID=UPI0036E333FA